MMEISAFGDAALVLVGHGSSLCGDSTAAVRQHAAALRQRGFAQVVEAFWEAEPKLERVWTRLPARRIFVVPLFASDGYFTEEAIPEALGLRQATQSEFVRTRASDGRRLHYCRPVGTHPRMTEVILARAAEVVARHPFPRAPLPAETALFLAGHGTDRNSKSRQSVECHADLIRQRELFAQVQAVFLEEKPRVAEVFKLAAVRNIVVVPFFMSDGPHVTADIPILLGASEQIVRNCLERSVATWRNPTERHGKRLWYSACVGTDPRLADIILDRVKEATA